MNNGGAALPRRAAGFGPPKPGRSRACSPEGLPYSLHAVVRRFLCDDHVVHVAFTQAGG
jgi:hypothetical protein